MDGIPDDVWMCLGEEGIDMLSIWCKVYTSRRIYQRRQNTAAQAFVDHGRSTSSVDECGVFYWNPGRFDQFWTLMVKKAEAIDVDWYLEEKTAHAIWWWAVRVKTLRMEPRGPPSSGIVWCQWYHLSPASVIIIWAQYMFHTLEWLLIIAWNNEDYAKILTRPHSHMDSLYLLMTPVEYPLHSFSSFHYFLFKCIWVPGMCPEPRWIDYPAPRSPPDSFIMAGPIRRCLLRACIKGYATGITYHLKFSNAPLKTILNIKLSVFYIVVYLCRKPVYYYYYLLKPP